MKKFLLILSMIFFVFEYASDAQEKSEWTRVETADKDLSVSFPSDFLVDAEKQEDRNQQMRIIGFQNDVVMELAVYDESEPKKRIQQISSAVESKKLGNGKGDFVIKRFSNKDDAEYFYETVFLASDKKFYRLSVHSKDSDKIEFSRFLYSIKVGGKPIFINKNVAQNDSEKVIVSLAGLKTSPTVLEALNKKFKSSERKITYIWDTKVTPTENQENWSRPYIILVRPLPSNSVLAVKPGYFLRRREGNGDATFKVKLLANGQIGDITVFSKADRALLFDLIEGVKEIRFLPAMKGDKPIDAEWIVKVEAFGL